MVKIIISLALALLSGLFYRFGGIGKPFKSWMRDWVCPAFALATLLLWWHVAPWYELLVASLVSYGFMGAAFSTYWDFIFKKDNFYAHGFFVGLATFPFIFIGYAWWAVLAQALISGLAMGLWCKYNDKDYVEEGGRGFIASIVRIIHG